MSEILTKDKKHVTIFAEGVKVDKDLPKYKLMEERKPVVDDRKVEMSASEFFGSSEKLPVSLSYEVLKEHFTKDKESDLAEFNLSVSDNMRKVVKNTTFYRDGRLAGEFGETMNEVSVSNKTNGYVLDGSRKSILLNVIKGWFKQKKASVQKILAGTFDDDKEYTFDVIKFFSQVKGISEESAALYRNRIEDYINCIGMAEVSGQTAMKEKLFKELVINKYESVLHANGMDKLVTEQVIVDLCQKSPKQLCLDYISNYTRTIPLNIIKKKLELDKLEIFDNYVILHYDPSGIATAKTDEEKKKEVDKAKDPILFGVIVGSNKLYYVDDWIDEHCDLTLDKISEIIGKEIVEQNFLQDKIK